MRNIDYKRASVLLFDPVGVNLRNTRYALHEIGFREISCLSSMAEFKRRLEDTSPDLIVAELVNNENELLRAVRAVRSGELGRNPFVVFVFTSWVRDGNVIKQAIDSGIDDVIIRPFSTAFAEERIRTLVRARKPFVVTSDYIGPDRRKDIDRGIGAGNRIEAPNTLQVVTECDDSAVDEANRWIAEARRTVEMERIRRLCMRMTVGVEVGVRELNSGNVAVLDLEDLTRTAKELRLRLARQNAGEASRIAFALYQVCEELMSDGGFTLANLNLVKELAMGVLAAYSGGEGVADSLREIEMTVEALRRRLAAPRQLESGKTKEPELQRAAS
ncbi:MAG: response regulator [Caulobacterales bacterium]|uniref:response regulator n=1 Tax=Glycocaulis sp. TaxID=1969725 RepID=UPI003FA1717F